MTFRTAFWNKPFCFFVIRRKLIKNKLRWAGKLKLRCGESYLYRDPWNCSPMYINFVANIEDFPNSTSQNNLATKTKSYSLYGRTPLLHPKYKIKKKGREAALISFPTYPHVLNYFFRFTYNFLQDTSSLTGIRYGKKNNKKSHNFSSI